MTYTVTIIETLALDIEIEADDEEAAEDSIREQYRNMDIVLDSDSYVDTGFVTKPLHA